MLACGAKAPPVAVDAAVPPAAPTTSVIDAGLPAAPTLYRFLTPDDAKLRQIENHFPRIEIYTENRDHPAQSFIDRSTWLLDPAEKPGAANLLEAKLTILPCFKETRPVQTLKGYFDLAAAPHLTAWRDFLPRHLEGYQSFPEADRVTFGSLIEYQKYPPNSIEIVWLSPDQWYINNVFYHADYDDQIKNKAPIVDANLLPGTLRDFIRFSPVVQQKLDEGLSFLRLPQALRVPMQDTVVLVLQKTPGSPGTEDWEYALKFDGALSNTKARLPHHRVAALLTALETLDRTSLSSATPTSHVDDGQALIFRAWLWPPLTFGPGGGDMPPAFAAYFEATRALLEATSTQR